MDLVRRLACQMKKIGFTDENQEWLKPKLGKRKHSLLDDDAELSENETDTESKSDEKRG